MPNRSALSRSHRTASVVSSMAAGYSASPLKR